MSNKNWFRKAGLGLFVHYQASSILGRGEWVKYQENLTNEEYYSSINQFTVKNCDPEEWVKLAKSTGMKYAVLTAKHHDGYCLFKTKTTSLSCCNFDNSQDIVGKFVKACRKHNIKIGLYFSLPDWSKEAFFIGPDKDKEGWKQFLKYTKIQLTELFTQYGKIDLLWYDNIIGQSGDRQLTSDDYKSRRMNKEIRKLQPDILINDRSLIDEDFYTAEQSCDGPSVAERLWEACYTSNKHWAYFPADNNWKTATELIHILSGCASKGGNLLLNVGPNPEGLVPYENYKSLKSLGEWMENNGEAIYGTKFCNYNAGTSGVFTLKGNVLYLIVHWWHGNKIVLPNCMFELKEASFLSSKQKINFEYRNNNLILNNLPKKSPDKYCTVIKLKVKKFINSETKLVETNFRNQLNTHKD